MRIAAIAAVCLLGTGPAHAQAVDRRYAEEPTDGVGMPTAPMAGEFDGRVVATNPGGLPLVRGAEVAMVLDLEDTGVATSAGQGFGTYLAYAGGGSVLPRFGLGMGLEWLRPSRENLEPDPGKPFRFTLDLALGLGKHAGFGVAWHHFHDDGRVDGLDTFDLGLAGRLGNRFAVGATVTDLATNPVEGAPVQRRYAVELMTRPFATDRLEFAIGGRLGETRLDTDGWARINARIARGVFVQAQVESRELHVLADSPMGTRDLGSDRDLRATVGIELSFGQMGVGFSATGLRDDTGKNHALGGQTLVRVSGLGPASVIGPSDHIERVELSGTIGVRELTGLVARLRAIAHDRTAKAVVVTFDGASAGWATLQELRDELLAVRRAGKKVFAYMVSGTGRDYFVASAADKIYIDPAGGLRLVGMAGTTIYFRGVFDQLGVLPQFEKIAEYKSAPEQFTDIGPSPTAAKMTNDLYDSLFDQWLEQVAASRKLSKDELHAIIDKGPFTSGDLAQNTQLVDAVAAPDRVSELVAKELGGILPVEAPPVDRPDRWERPKIAIIYVDGDITDGKSQSVPFLGRTLAGGETLVAALTAARVDPKIGAVILRIDSPGGSALASELIAREVFAMRGVKPMICSMSDLAASGGYFVATGCEMVFAEPMTITGSIGIFYGKFDVSGLLRKLGATTNTFKRGQRADVESYFRPYTADEQAMLMEKLRYLYGRFVGAVAEGRGMKKDEVDAVGRGHVWTGAQARPIRLVDKFGGLGDAIDEAKHRMGIAVTTKVQLVELPALPGGLFGTIGKLFGVHESAGLSVTDLPIVRELLRSVPASLLIDPAGAQARLPYDVSWGE